MAKKLTANKAREILHDKSVHGHPLTDKQRRFFGAIAGGAPIKAETGGWLDKYDDGGVESRMGGLTDKGFNYNSAWGGQFQTGGNIQPPMSGANQIVPMAQVGTKLSKNEEVKYQTWKSKLPKNLQWEGDYDLRGLWKENPNAQPSPNLHFTDKYKLPNHPTFSNESIYFNPETKKYAGYWNETDSSWNYTPYDTLVKKQIIEKKFAMGGSLPGATGFMYARTHSPAPSEGPYAKKTMPSAENGMTYYQHGLDWKPRNISRDGSVIKDDRGQWAHPGEITEIGSNRITMQGVNYPVLGISDKGDTQMMYPEGEYKFKGKKVTEFPMAQKGKQLPPIYTSNPNDPKLKDYQNRLNAYNKGKALWNKNYFDRFSESVYPKDYDRLSSFLSNNSKEYVTSIGGPYAIGLIDTDEIDFPIYEKPQPIIYQEPILKPNTTPVQRIPMRGATTPSIIDRTGPGVEVPDVYMGDYMLGYTDVNNQGVDQAFLTPEQREAFLEELRKSPGYRGSTEYQRVKKKETGGWLNQYK